MNLQAKQSAAEARLEAFNNEFTEVGDAENCINPRRIRNIQIIDKQHILFRLSSRDYVVNKLPRTCWGLRRGAGLIYSPVAMRLCSVDTVRIFDNMSSRAFQLGPVCGLGKFTPVRRRNEDQENLAAAIEPLDTEVEN
ncbi:MAG: hypothetical protein AAF387_16585 [Pseudomonadota bacterium]